MALVVAAMQPRHMVLPIVAGLTCMSFGLGDEALPGSGLVAVAVFTAVGSPPSGASRWPPSARRHSPS